MPDASTFGMIAEFGSPEDLVAAVKNARSNGYRRMDAFSPFPVPELPTLLDLHDSRVLWLGLFGGIFGCLFAFVYQLYTNYDFPIDVGGRPQYALSAFAVVAFELTILFSALTTAIGMLAMNGLPRLHHPLFSIDAFARASRDRFFLCIMANDEQFDPHQTQAFLTTLKPISIALVPS